MKTEKLEHRQFLKLVALNLTQLNSKVTDYQTIQRYMKYLQGLAEQFNMPYVNITLDVGAAINTYFLEQSCLVQKHHYSSWKFQFSQKKFSGIKRLLP